MTAWLADIRDPDFALRYWAARYLGELTPPFSPEVLAALLPATADIDPEVRLQAMLGLKRGLSADPPIIRALIAALQRRDDPAFTWEVARDSLAKIGAPALTEVVKLLDSNEREILTRAVDVLEKSGPAARPFLPKLAALIGDNRIHYSTITSAMREIDVAASVQLLVPMARNPQRRENVLAALGDLGGSFYHVDKPSPVADQIVAVLTDALDDPSDHIRSVAVASLRQLGWRAKPALPKLRAMLKSIPEDAQWPKLQRKTVEQVIWEIE
jgi:HEAT repeat protein